MVDATTLQFATSGLNLANNFVFDSAVGQGVSFDTGANTAQLSGQISGTDSLVKAGTGTLILSGNNTYTGGTTLSAGILRVGVDTVGTITSSAIGTASTV